MHCNSVIYSTHATTKMFSRAIAQTDVEYVLLNGNQIMSYPTDKPHPSHLRFALVNNRPIHVVVAQDILGNCYVITVYEPDITIWNNDFTTKK